jgi:hypothetical protein
MPTTYKVLGQINPSAATDTTLYTVPSGNSAVISTVSICNRSATSTTFRLAIRPAGASISNTHYLCFDTIAPANDTIYLTVGLSLAATDVITANTAAATVTFSAFGSEIY